MIKLHPVGIKTVVYATIILIVLEVTASMLLQLPLFIVATVVIITTFILIIRFFRIPKRGISTNKNHIISPADGKVVAIEKVIEDEYFKDERIIVSIFMTIYNVHINWFPIAGVVKYFKYHPGKFLVAWNPKSSKLNERSTIVIESENKEILVRQIAGFVARRIVCYANPGREIKQSEEMGFIKFGSRLDVYLPTDSKILVKIGDKTVGGLSAIASFE